MSEYVELSSLNLRYEGHRQRDDAREARLLASIAERGIEAPLEGVDTPAGRFLRILDRLIAGPDSPLGR
mgnify:CR=1 FL=1